MAGRSSLGRILYFSRCAGSLDTNPGSESLQALTRTCKRANEFGLISSIVVQDGGWFLQLLEGERGILSQTFQRISKDKRHQEVLIVEWADALRRELLLPFSLIQRTRNNEQSFRKFSPAEELKKGHPKSSWATKFLLELQTIELAKADRSGIEAYL